MSIIGDTGDFAELFATFMEESDDTIDKLRSGLPSLLNPEQRAATLDATFRGVHTIKGGSAMFEIDELTRCAHQLENYLAELKRDASALDDAAMAHIRQGIDDLEEMVHRASASARQTPTERTAPAAQPASTSAVTPSDNDTSLSSTGGPSVARESSPQSRDALRQRTVSPEVIRVPVDRIQASIDLVSELFLFRNQLAYIVEREFSQAQSLGHVDFLRNWEILDSSLSRTISDLESVTMSMRMMPVKKLFSRMRKTVETYCSQSPKQISVETDGEDAELDKKLLDTLAEPLVHLIRNAMDHGIENADVRVAANKPPHGKIWLTAEVVGNEVVLRIRDDGRGMDAERIKQKAKERGIDVSRIRTHDEAIQLIALPGFSTAETVSDISGRGVGMDAVKSYVEDVGGSLNIDTRLGEGTTFTLRLPLGLSVIPALIVRIGVQNYAISTHDIQYIKTIQSKDIRESNGKAYILANGQFTRCYDLEEHLCKPVVPRAVIPREVAICVTKIGDREVAFRLSALVANADVVVKPLPALAPRLNSVSGVCVLATGEPAFVLAVERLLRTIEESDDPHTHAVGGPRAAA